MDEPVTVIDLSDFLPEDEQTIEILSPRKQPTGWCVTLAGPGHPESISVANQMLNDALWRRHRIETGHTHALIRHAPNERRERVEQAVRRIIGWSPVRIAGELFEFSPDTAKDLLGRPSMGWALQQITDALADDRTFSAR